MIVNGKNVASPAEHGLLLAIRQDEVKVQGKRTYCMQFSVWLLVSCKAPASC